MSATPVSDLDLPFTSLGSSPGRDRSTRRQLAEDEAWLLRTELGYMVVGYDDAQAVLRDRRWHSGLPRLIDQSTAPELAEWRAERQPVILQLDGPDHQRLRQLLSPALTPSAVDRLRPLMRQVFDDMLDGAIGADGCDFVDAVCQFYPVRIIFEVLGVPQERIADFSTIARSAGEARLGTTTDPAAIMEATIAFDHFAGDLVEQIDAVADSDGLIADLLAAERRGGLSRAELVSLVQTMLVAGTESTTAQLGCAIALFARFDEQYQLVRRRPELVAGAAEEVMRYLGAVRGTARVAITDIDYRDVRFPEGTLLILGFTPANRDRSRFAEPDMFDATRLADPPHLTLGHGIHYCLGAALARAELQVAVGALAERVERIEVTGEIEWRPQSAEFWGPSVLPVTLHPAIVQER